MLSKVAIPPVDWKRLPIGSLDSSGIFWRFFNPLYVGYRHFWMIGRWGRNLFDCPQKCWARPLQIIVYCCAFEFEFIQAWVDSLVENYDRIVMSLGPMELHPQLTDLQRSKALFYQALPSLLDQSMIQNIFSQILKSTFYCYIMKNKYNWTQWK